MLSRTGSRQLPDKSLVTWRACDEDRLRRAAGEAARLVVLEEGKAVTHELLRFESLVYVVDALVECSGVPIERSKRAMVQASLFRLGTCNRQDLPTFRRVLAARVRRYLNRPEQTYRIVLPLNVRESSTSRRGEIRVGEVSFMVLGWREVQDSTQFTEWLNAAQGVGLPSASALFHNFTPLVVTVRAKSADEAFEACYDQFELLRATLNLEAFYRHTRQFGRRKPLSKCQPPPVYGIFEADGTYKHFYYEEGETRDYKQFALSSEELDRKQNLLDELTRNTAETSVEAVVAKTVWRYGEALDTSDWPKCYLTLWWALEHLTFCSTGNYSNKAVRSRAMALLGNDRFLADVLDVCLERRNQLVHTGVFPDEGLAAVNMLKMVVEACINAVYRLRHVCSDWAALETYYENVSANNATLERRAQVIKAIQRQRQDES